MTTLPLTSKKFAIEKQAQKVQGRNLTVIDDEGNTQTEPGGTEQGGTTNPPSGGGENEDGE